MQGNAGSTNADPSTPVAAAASSSIPTASNETNAEEFTPEQEATKSQVSFVGSD